VFRRFLCENGADFYGLPVPERTFELVREPDSFESLITPDGPVTPLPVGMGLELPWRLDGGQGMAGY